VAQTQVVIDAAVNGAESGSVNRVVGIEGAGTFETKHSSSVLGWRDSTLERKPKNCTIICNDPQHLGPGQQCNKDLASQLVRLLSPTPCPNILHGLLDIFRNNLLNATMLKFISGMGHHLRRKRGCVEFDGVVLSVHAQHDSRPRGFGLPECVLTSPRPKTASVFFLSLRATSDLFPPCKPSSVPQIVTLGGCGEAYIGHAWVSARGLPYPFKAQRLNSAAVPISF
jgi:hypothetical protein